MFDRNDLPKKVDDVSLDFRLCIGIHVCTMVAIAGHLVLKLGIISELFIVGAAAASAVFLSVRKRIACGWRWPSAKGRDVLGVVGATILMLFFIGSALPGSSPFNPQLFPWCAAGFNILVFAVLSGLNVVCQSEREFQKQCGALRGKEPGIPPGPSIPGWKRTVATTFKVYFILVWISGVAFFWKFNEAFHGGSPAPTITQTEKLTSHGRVVFITSEKSRAVHLLEHVMAIGIPSIFVIGAILHLVGGVKVFSNTTENPLRRK